MVGAGPTVTEDTGIVVGAGPTVVEDAVVASVLLLGVAVLVGRIVVVGGGAERASTSTR